MMRIDVDRMADRRHPSLEEGTGSDTGYYKSQHFWNAWMMKREGPVNLITFDGDNYMMVF